MRRLAAMGLLASVAVVAVAAFAISGASHDMPDPASPSTSGAAPAISGALHEPAALGDAPPAGEPGARVHGFPGTITVGGARTHESGASAPKRMPIPWTAYSYPAEIALGEPFTVNYTWSYVKTYRESSGDEYPPDDLDKYPWAQTWVPDREWEDENDMLVWQEIEKPFYPDYVGKLSVYASDKLSLLNEEFEHDASGDWVSDDDYLKFAPIPYDLLENNTGSLEFRIDEPVMPRNHELVISFTEFDHEWAHLYMHFNGTKGYITENEIMFFDDPAAQGAAGSQDLPNPLHCISDERWERWSYEEKRWEYKYPSGYCDGKPPYSPSSSASAPYNGTPAGESQASSIRQWLENNNVTENVEEYVRGTLYQNDEEVEHFFSVYPELRGKFILPFSSASEAHAAQAAAQE